MPHSVYKEVSSRDLDEKIKAEELALSHAWAWFALHAGQRMQVINYYLITIALILAGYGVAFQSQNFLIAATVALAGLGVSVAFWMLDRRTKELVKAAEVPLRELQRRLAVRTSLPTLTLVALVEKPGPRTVTYSRAIGVLTIVVSVLMVVALVVALVTLSQSPTTAAPLPTPAPTP
ncbi:hypothetical protein [Agromyces subbeticus]|uniref:RipA family octameric membrane protein n=1 Tax=Agromyces subbeticus TaxID=293890 RepID=UPI0012EC9EE6|nr:hypothetical protein [Agromyces subbeticus]